MSYDLRLGTSRIAARTNSMHDEEKNSVSKYARQGLGLQGSASA